eukprot:TRINITY_DN56_c9_g1_i1.p1 TRINITY_DN56_c9_g1~~TRINITY_DN56_c9_g1_i1.p1  ORF type:complete len:225 (-),score=47.48 TRINITY_DN56_c9_g1_i1:200-874(-)
MGNVFKNDINPDYLKPSNIYDPQAIKWDPKLMRKLILDKKVAPFFPSQEQPSGETEECPICLLYYTGGLNRSKCCKKGVCTECYFAIRPPSPTRVDCPFCQQANFTACYLGPLSVEERKKIEEEEIKVRELEQKALKEREEQKKKEEEEKEKAKANKTITTTTTTTTTNETETFNIIEDPEPNFDDDLEILMLNEAIRRSMLESNELDQLPPFLDDFHDAHHEN